MVPAYNGSEPYIFVSYAHKDSAEVYSTIEKLTSLGYRIWYDEGIKPGVEWPEYIAEHLDKCSLFLMFISPNSMESANCRREINFALSRAKKFLCIVLKKTEIPLGMELQLASQQSIFRYKYSSEGAYIYKICSAAGMSQCKNTHFFENNTDDVPEAVSAPPVASIPAPVKQPQVQKKTVSRERNVKKKSSGSSGSGKSNAGTVFIGILIGTIIIFAFTFYMLTHSNPSGGNAAPTLTPTPTVTATPTPTPTPEATPTPTPVITQHTQIAGDTAGTNTQTGGNTGGTSGGNTGGTSGDNTGGTSGGGATSDDNTGNTGTTDDEYDEVDDFTGDAGNEDTYDTGDEGENTGDVPTDNLNYARYKAMAGMQE